MCSSGDQKEKSTEDMMNQFAQQLTGAFSTSFAKSQSILGSLQSQLTSTMTNPHGFDPKTLASMKTAATDESATRFSQATAQAGAYTAARGGADLGSGVAAQISGQVGAAAATEAATAQNQISIANGQLQNQNYWQGVQGLQQVAATQAGVASSASSNASNSANASTNAGQALLASQQAQFNDVMSGIKAGTGLLAA